MNRPPRLPRLLSSLLAFIIACAPNFAQNAPVPEATAPSATPVAASTSPTTKPADSGLQWEVPLAPGGGEARRLSSRLLGRHVAYAVALPPGYHEQINSSRRYPVVYWLHGAGAKTVGNPAFVAAAHAAMETGACPAFLIVMPNGLRDSYYTDWKDGTRPVESILVEELLPEIDSTFRTIAKREARIIEGFSMGGYGAARLAYRHPHLFGAVSVIASGFPNPESLQKPDHHFVKTIHGADSRDATEQSVWRALEQNRDKISGHTLIRVVYGLEDRTRDFIEEALPLYHALGIEPELHVFSGIGHDSRALYRALGEANWRFYSDAFAQTLSISNP